MKIKYLISTDGKMKFLRWISSLISWSLIVSIHDFTFLKITQFSAAILIISWLLDSIWIILHLTAANELIYVNLTKVNVLVGMILSGNLFLVSLLLVKEADNPAWQNAEVFVIVSLVLWLGDILVSLRKSGVVKMDRGSTLSFIEI